MLTLERPDFIIQIANSLSIALKPLFAPCFHEFIITLLAGRKLAGAELGTNGPEMATSH